MDCGKNFSYEIHIMINICSDLYDMHYFGTHCNNIDATVLFCARNNLLLHKRKHMMKKRVKKAGSF